MEYNRLKDINSTLKDHINEKLGVTFLLSEVYVGKQSNGGYFLSIIMQDGDNKRDGKKFGVKEEIKYALQEGAVYNGVISIKRYDKGQDGISCTIDDLQLTDIEADDFVPKIDTANSRKIIDNVLKLLDGSVYGDIANDIINRYIDKFEIYPAGKSMHHDKLGALIFHSATMARTGVEIANIYNSSYSSLINGKLLLTGTILHDLAKIMEYNIDPKSYTISMSEDSFLETHITMCITEIDRTAVRLGVENTEEVKLLKHMIAAHHGKLEWGSPIEPNIPEAYMLHTLDMLDAEMWRYDRAFKDMKAGEFKSDKSFGYYKSVFKDSSKV